MGEFVWVCSEPMDPDRDFNGIWKKAKVLTDGELKEVQFVETEEIARSVGIPFKVSPLFFRIVQIC